MAGLVESYYDHGENPLWVPLPEFPGRYMALPERVMSRIISFLPRSPPFPDSSTVIERRTLTPLSRTNRWFRGLLRNDVFSTIYITSPRSLRGFINHLSMLNWKGRDTAIRCLTLHWHQSIPLQRKLYTISTIDRRKKAQDLTTDLQCLLANFSEGLQELTIDFPGAMSCFQDAVFSQPSSLKKPYLRRISIRNGGRPVFPNARQILCVMSYLASDTLEVLKIDGDSPVLEGPWTSLKPGLMLLIPEANTFAEYKNLSELTHIEVRNLPGFYDSHLAWLCNNKKLRPQEGGWSDVHRGHTLFLDSNPHLTQTGIVTMLKLIGDGLETLKLTHLVLSKMPGYVPSDKKAWRPSWWLRRPAPFAADENQGMERAQDDEHFCDVIREHCKGLRRLEIYTHSVCRNIFFPTPNKLPPPPYRPGEPRFGMVSLRLPSREGGVESTLCRGDSGAGGVGLSLVADEAIDKGAVDEFVRIRGFWKGVSKFRLNRRKSRAL